MEPQHAARLRLVLLWRYLMQIETEIILTGHTDVICSTSIERIVIRRNVALTQIEALIQRLDNISLLTFSLGWGWRQRRIGE